MASIVPTPPLVCSSKPISAQACAITFQGNASNGQQQDAFFFIDDWHQIPLGITEVRRIDSAFCVAVADGVASSPYSQHCSKAVVKAVDRLWQQLLNEKESVLNQEESLADYQINASQSSSGQAAPLIIPTQSIHQTINRNPHPSKHLNAASTLALVTGQPVLSYATAYQLRISHVGDSRVYLLRLNSDSWQCLTRDHNLLNDMVDEQARASGKQASFEDYNAENMAGSLYSITECFVFASDDSSHAPDSSSQLLTVTAGDCIVVCSDGIHDLVPSHQWPLIDEQTCLQGWLKHLKSQVYTSVGNAYDNGTAIVIRFE